MSSDIEALRRAVEASQGASDRINKGNYQQGVSVGGRRLNTQQVIVAGNDAQAEAYVRAMQINLIDVTIAHDVLRIMGLQVFDVVFTGTWYRRPDLQELLNTLQANVIARRLREDADTGTGAYAADTASTGPSAVMQQPSYMTGKAIASLKTP